MASAASSYSSRETITLQLPSGELVDADVPAGLSDEEINTRMHQQHPEFYPAQVSDSMRDQALKSIPKPAAPMDEQYLIGGEPIQPTGKHVLSEASDLAKGAISSAAEVSTPNIIQQLFNHSKGRPNSLRDLPSKAAMFLLPLMGGYGAEGESTGASSAIGEENQAVAAGQGRPQALARNPVPSPADVPLYQRLGIKTSPGFQMPPVREPVPLDPAAQMRQKPGIEPRADLPAAPSGQSQGIQGDIAETPARLWEKTKASLAKLDPTGKQSQPLTTRAVKDGNLYQYKSGHFLKNGEIQEDAEGIVEVTDALEPQKFIEGRIAPTKLNAASPSQFPPPASVYETEPRFSGAMRDRFGRPVDDAGIQEMMQDRFTRDEAVNESQILKRQAAGNSMDTPKGVQSDQFAQSQGKAPKPRQSNEYGYKKPINQVQSFSDLTDLLRQSVKEANMRKSLAAPKAGARR